MISFFVPGKPQAQGSKVKGRWGNLREDNDELGPWRERVALAAYRAMWGCEGPTLGAALLDGPITVGLEFVLYRPKSANKNKPTPPATKKPDIDKLERAILDALTGVIFGDDSQVVTVLKHKRVAEFGESPGVHVCVLTASETSPVPQVCYPAPERGNPSLVSEDGQ